MCGDSTKYISQVYILTIFFWLFIDTLDLLHHSEKKRENYNLKEKTLASGIKKFFSHIYNINFQVINISSLEFLWSLPPF